MTNQRLNKTPVKLYIAVFLNAYNWLANTYLQSQSCHYVMLIVKHTDLVKQMRKRIYD